MQLAAPELTDTAEQPGILMPPSSKFTVLVGLAPPVNVAVSITLAPWTLGLVPLVSVKVGLAKAENVIVMEPLPPAVAGAPPLPPMNSSPPYGN